eukprot:COSAG02_NODE_526_length_20707_cov_11.431337_1_plen_64_part_00
MCSTRSRIFSPVRARLSILHAVFQPYCSIIPYEFCASSATYVEMLVLLAYVQPGHCAVASTRV